MNEIFITDYQTVKGENFPEISLERFLKLLIKNIESDNYDVLYNKDDNCFDIVFNDNKYLLKLNELKTYNFEMRNYLNYVTRELMRLSKEQNNLNVIKEVQETKIIRQNEAIALAGSGKISNDSVRLIYIDHLKQSKKPSLLKIKNYFFNLKTDIVDSVRKTFDILGKKIWPFNSWGEDVAYIVFNVLMCIVVMLNMVIVAIVDEWTFIRFLPSILVAFPDLSITAVCAFKCLKSRTGRLMETFVRHRMLNEKIKNLEAMNFSDTKSMMGQKIGELVEDKTEPLEQVSLSDYILNDINHLGYILKSIKSKERVNLAISLDKLLRAYLLRMDQINNNKKIGLTVIDEESRLKLEMFNLLSSIELQIKELLGQERGYQLRNQEAQTVQDTLEEITKGAYQKK